MSRQKTHHTKQFKVDAINYRKEHPDLTQVECAKNLGNCLRGYLLYQQLSWQNFSFYFVLNLDTGPQFFSDDNLIYQEHIHSTNHHTLFEVFYQAKTLTKQQTNEDIHSLFS